MNRSLLARPIFRFVIPLLFAAVACASPNIPNPYRMPTLIPLNKPTNTVMPPAATPSPQINPRIELRVSATSIKVGETLTVTAQAVDLGLPIFSVRVKDGNGDFQQLALITYDNKTREVKDLSKLLEFVSGSGGLNQATLVFRGRAVGTASIQINATGEIHYGYPGPATFGGGSSPTMTITVMP